MIACIGEPISWPRLERFAQTRADAAIAAHVAQCPACRQCVDEIASDVVALPPLVIAVVAPRRTRWWWFALPAFAVAALIVLVMRPRPRPANVASIKGVGDVTLALVRERGGSILEDATTFARGDRWKLVLTCAPGHLTAVSVEVVEAGSKAADRPLAPAQIACGNRVVVPGAFELTGTVANRICVQVTSEGDTDRACITVTPED
ncbi:MAG: hypothetical protein ABI591_12180 [Kofleriaceae bacterium]